MQKVLVAAGFNPVVHMLVLVRDIRLHVRPGNRSRWHHSNQFQRKP